MADLSIELRGIAEELAAGSGFWRSCSGCHELNDGAPTGPHSAVFRCHLGVGCRECGGLGAVWDDTDYDAMAEFMAQADAGVAPTAAPGVGPCAQCPTLVIPAGFSCAQCGRTSGVPAAHPQQCNCTECQEMATRLMREAAAAAGVMASDGGKQC